MGQTRRSGAASALALVTGLGWASATLGTVRVLAAHSVSPRQRREAGPAVVFIFPMRKQAQEGGTGPGAPSSREQELRQNPGGAVTPESACWPQTQ